MFLHSSLTLVSENSVSISIEIFICLLDSEGSHDMC